MMGERGVAVYWIKAIVAVVIAGAIWYIGNLVLFSDQGIATTVENLSPGYFGNTDAAIKWFWNVFPFIFLIGAAIYVIYGALTREPRTF